jgi:hypothetical protein
MHSKRRLLVVAAAILSLAALAPSVAATPRAGDIHITKECSAYSGAANQFCTITTSNVPAIPPGTKVIYLSALAAPYTTLDTDIVLDPPGPGNNMAFGHVHLDLGTGVGTATFSGGTGMFTWFHASVGVSYLGGVDWAWEGAYRFGSGS